MAWRNRKPKGGKRRLGNWQVLAVLREPRQVPKDPSKTKPASKSPVPKRETCMGKNKRKETQKKKRITSLLG